MEDENACDALEKITMKDHNILLNRLKWKAANKDFTDMEKFATDSIVYVFAKPLNYDELNGFMDFIGNSDHLNHLTPVDFCNYFLRQHIKFTIKFRYVRQIGLRQNYRYYKIIRILRKKLKNIETE